VCGLYALGCADGGEAAPLDSGAVDGGRAAAGPLAASVDAEVEADVDAGSNGLADAALPPVEAGAVIDPARILRGDSPRSYWDLTVRGVALAHYEGKIVTVRLGLSERPPERIGLAQARIEGAAFELSFPQVWEASLYKAKLAFIDVDQNGRCDPAVDAVFSDYRAAMIGALELRESAAPAAQAAFSRSFDAETDCMALNAPWPES